MKVLKNKFKKKFKKVAPDGDKLEYKPVLKRIVIKPKLGRWCKYYEGRLPYPTECSYNKDMPITRLFKDGKILSLKDRSDCVKCNRNPTFIPWKLGVWAKISEAIKNGEDLSDMPAPDRD